MFEIRIVLHITYIHSRFRQTSDKHLYNCLPNVSSKTSNNPAAMQTLARCLLQIFILTNVCQMFISYLSWTFVKCVTNAYFLRLINVYFQTISQRVFRYMIKKCYISYALLRLCDILKRNVFFFQLVICLLIMLVKCHQFCFGDWGLGIGAMSPGDEYATGSITERGRERETSHYKFNTQTLLVFYIALNTNKRNNKTKQKQNKTKTLPHTQN